MAFDPSWPPSFPTLLLLCPTLSCPALSRPAPYALSLAWGLPAQPPYAPSDEGQGWQGSAIILSAVFVPDPLCNLLPVMESMIKAEIFPTHQAGHTLPISVCSAMAKAEEAVLCLEAGDEIRKVWGRLELGTEKTGNSVNCPGRKTRLETNVWGRHLDGF